MHSLKDKIVVVTGGSGFIGRSVVRAIAEHGGIAVVADIDSDACQRVVNEVGVLFPKQVTGVALDITDKTSITTLIHQLSTQYERIDAVVNCAYPRNRNYGRKLEDVTYEDFCENSNLHLGGYFLVAQQFALYFQQQGWGNIVNMGSIYGTMAPRFEIYSGTKMTMPVEYASIKAALIQLTRYFAQYFKGQHIRVNSLSPGGIFDNQPESFLKAYNAFCNGKGMLDPTDITGSLLFLLSDASKYVTGQNIIIDDGFHL
jgi:NAD(P)-dependent dehydrogenase (short-subunit alcohol dehydrogenase family)